MTISFTKKTKKGCSLSTLCSSMLWRERENGDGVCTLWKRWNLLHNRGYFNSERTAISFYVQTPKKVVNRNSVAHMRCSN